MSLQKIISEFRDEFLENGSSSIHQFKEGKRGKLPAEFEAFITKQFNEIIKTIEATPEWVEATDDDGHRYQIPSHRKHEWFRWLSEPDDDVPEFAERVDGEPVRSFKKEILEVLCEKQ